MRWRSAQTAGVRESNAEINPMAMAESAAAAPIKLRRCVDDRVQIESAAFGETRGAGACDVILPILARKASYDCDEAKKIDDR